MTNKTYTIKFKWDPKERAVVSIKSDGLPKKYISAYAEYSKVSESLYDFIVSLENASRRKVKKGRLEIKL